MSQPTEFELRDLPEPPQPDWSCEVPGCTANADCDHEGPEPETCEECRAKLCREHATRVAGYHLCLRCLEAMRVKMIVCAGELSSLAHRIVKGWSNEAERRQDTGEVAEILTRIAREIEE